MFRSVEDTDREVSSQKMLIGVMQTEIRVEEKLNRADEPDYR